MVNRTEKDWSDFDREIEYLTLKAGAYGSSKDTYLVLDGKNIADGCCVCGCMLFEGEDCLEIRSHRKTKDKDKIRKSHICYDCHEAIYFAGGDRNG